MSKVRDYINGAFQNDQVEEVGINGFVTIARVRERVTNTSDIPVTFLEDGSHVNDHVILNPTTISIVGNVSDVHLRAQPAPSSIIAAQSQVGAILQYVPARTATQVSKVSASISDLSNASDRVDAVINAGQRLSGYLGIGDNVPQSNIEKFLDMLESVRNSKTLIPIEMPYKTYPQMCITSLEITRDNQSRALSFSLDAQQFRFAQTTFESVAAPSPSTATGGQTEGLKDKGVQAGEDVSQSFLGATLERFGFSL